MKHNYYITTKSISLKPMDSIDAEKYRLIRNKFFSTNCFISSDIISKQQQIEWYNHYLQNKNDIMFSAYADKIFIGGNSLYNINRDTGIAEYGRLVVDPQYKGHSYGYLITMAALKIAKNSLNLKKVSLKVYKNNTKALHIYNKIGFKTINTTNNHNDNLLYMELTL